MRNPGLRSDGTGAGEMSAAGNAFPPFTVFDFNDAIRAHARQRSDEPAFIDGEAVLTWRQFDREVARVGEALVKAGIRKGDRVALLASNSFWAYAAMFGILRAGAVYTPLSTLLPPALLARLLTDSGARLLMAGSGWESPAIEATALVEPRPRVVFESGSRDGGEAFADFAGGCEGNFAGVPRDLQDTVTIIYSSGTTGVPKGIRHALGGRLGMAWQFGTALAVTAQARSVLATPPSSNGTMLLLLPTLYAGGTCILRRSLTPDDFFALLERWRPTHAFMVPTQFKAIFEDERARHADFSSLRCLFSAGAPMAMEVKRRVLELAGHCFHEVWGFTEGVGTVIYPGEVAARPQSVGRPLPGTDLRLIDSEGRELTPPAIGEIVGRSIMSMQGYLNRPDANAGVLWTDREGRVFLRTGDIGELDADGFLTIRGRIKDMIISGGLNVYPVDIEAVLLEHPDVDEAAVVGVPHEKWGEAPVAFVIARAGRKLDAAALRGWANERLAKHQRLVDVVLRAEDFPRNALGKVLKGELQKSYVSGRPGMASA